MTKPSRIIIFDTTLRDGEQSPGCSMNLDEKLRMAKQLARLKVDVKLKQKVKAGETILAKK